MAYRRMCIVMGEGPTKFHLKQLYPNFCLTIETINQRQVWYKNGLTRIVQFGHLFSTTELLLNTFKKKLKC